MPLRSTALTAAMMMAIPLAGHAQNTPPPHGHMTCEERSGALLDEMIAGHDDRAVDDFDASLARKMSPGTLGHVWHMLTRQAGSYHTRGIAKTSSLDGYTVVTTPMSFSRMTLDAQVACNDKGKIASLHFLPASTGSAPVAPGN